MLRRKKRSPSKPDNRLRPPAVAGPFYPDKEEALVDLLNRLAPSVRKKEKAVAVIVPHGSYFSCGPVMAEVYGRLALPPTAVIVGPNHSGIGERLSISSDSDWETPLGPVPVESELARALLKSVPGLKRDAHAHQYEHAVEVQLPFLKRWGKLRGFVPVAMGGVDLETARAVGRGLAEAVRRVGRETLLIASSSLSRYEPLELAQPQDRRLIDRILALDEEGLMEEVLQGASSICGAQAIAAVLAAAKGLGASRASLVKYEVGYAGIWVQ